MCRGLAAVLLVLIGIFAGCDSGNRPATAESKEPASSEETAVAEIGAPNTSDKGKTAPASDDSAPDKELETEQPQKVVEPETGKPATTDSVSKPRTLASNPYERDPDWRQKAVRELSAESKRIAIETARKAEELGIPLRIEGPNGYVRELSHFEGDKPIYRETRNANAAISTGVDLIRDQAPFVDGTGISVGVWDGGSVRETHVEFGTRVTDADSAPADNHATHVGGTIAAAGVTASAKGMAPGANIISYDWNDDRPEMTAIGASYPGEPGKIYLSNHSYGYGRGWVFDDGNWKFYGDTSNTDTNGEEDAFGQYSNNSVALDNIANLNPYYLILWASGNDRNDGPSAGNTVYLTFNASTSVVYDPAIHPLGDGQWRENGYENIADEAIAKNLLTIGAVDDAVLNGTRNLANAAMSGFSTWGPTDDGRIKPDLVANGVNLNSPIATSDNSYSFYSGTSMATPNATGSAALLVDYFDVLFPGHVMRSSTLKGLLIHTADDLGTTGPDYQFGYGLVNAKAAADLLKTYADYPSSSALRESYLDSVKVSETFTFTSDGTSPIRVTLSWTDPSGTARTGLNDHTPVLVHDLDLTVTDPNQTDHFPYVMPFALDETNLRSAAAVQQENNVDNVEHIYIETPTAGQYTITVYYDGGLGSEQAYSLIVSGAENVVTQTTPIVDSVVDFDTGVARLEGSDFLLGANVTLTKDATTLEGYGIMVSPDRIDFLYDATIVTNLSEWTVSVENPLSPLSNPLISLSTDALAYTADVGETIPDQIVTIENIGIGTFDYTISSDSAWLTVSPSSGTVGQTPTSLTVTADRTGLQAGLHVGQLIIESATAANAPREIIYTLGLKAPIAESLENETLAYTNDVANPWIPVVIEGSTNDTALASPPIGNDTTTTFSIEVTGPGLLSFDWLVDSETDFDFLRCYMNDVLVAQISGLDKTWRTRFIEIPPSQTTVRWSYEKDAFTGEGQDRGWIDNIQFEQGGGSLNTILEDGFDGPSINDQWATEIVANTGGNDPALDLINQSVNPADFTPVAGTDFLRFNSYLCDAGDAIQLKTVDPLPTSEAEYVSISFYWSRDAQYSTNGDNLQLQWSTDGSTWQTIGNPYYRYRGSGQNEWLYYTAELPPEALGQDIFFALLFTGDWGNDCHFDELKIEALSNNEPPTAINIDNTSIDETQAIGSLVGNLSTTDPDTADSHTYTLVAGEGDTDNAAFSIDGNTLLSAEIFDFETKNDYSVRIRSTDTAGASTENSFTITINDLNEPPTAITIDNTSIDENQAIGSLVGNLSTTDPDTGDTHSYAMVAGEGDTDNAAFSIDGNTLLSAEIFDFETKNDYSVRIRSTDTAGASTENSFTISINDLNEPPTAITIDNTSIDETQAIGSLVGNLSTTDPDTADSRTYTLVAGDGDTDNTAFSITGNTLLSAEIFDFETKNNYSVRIRSTDTAGASTENSFTISINDLNEPPTAITIDNTSIDENQAIGSLVGNLSTTDPDTADSHTYTLVAGDGDTDNTAFSITGNTLLSAEIFDFETKNNYSVRIRSTDAAGASTENSFTITINDLNEPPTDLSISNTSIPFESEIGTVVGTLLATDPDGNETFTYTLTTPSESNNNDLFSVVLNELQVTSAIPSPGIYSVDISATDSEGNTIERSINITGTATAQITISNLQHTYDGTRKAVNVTTTPEGLTVDLTYEGSESAPSNAGTYEVVAIVNDSVYNGTETASLEISPAPVTITLGELNFFYDGSPKAITATTMPADISLSITYDGSIEPPTAAGTYAIDANVADSNYAGTTSGQLNITYAQELLIDVPTSVPENRVLEIPVYFTSQGNVAGVTLEITYDSTYLRSPNFAWNPDIDGGSFSIAEEANTVRILNTQSVSNTLPSGPIQLGTLSFITRSGLTGTSLQIAAPVVNLSDENGDPLNTYTNIQSDTFALEQRTLVGDANNNGSIDISDSAELVRLILNPDPTRTWDVTLNDLSADSELDAGDIIKTLRIIAGLDTPVQIPQPASLSTDVPQPITATASDSHQTPPISTSTNTEASITWNRTSPNEVTAEISLPFDEPDVAGLTFVVDYPIETLNIAAGTALSTTTTLPANASVIWNVTPGNDYANQTGEVHFAASWQNGTTLTARSTLVSLIFTVTEAPSATVHYPLRVRDIEFAPAENLGPGLPVALADAQTIYSRSYEDWAQSTFGDTSISGDADQDSDGFSNEDEFLASTDPNDPNDRFLPTYSQNVSDSDFSLQINSVFGVKYQLEASTDLSLWEAVGSESVDPSFFVGDGQLLEFSLPAPASQSKRFYRIRIVP